ncbi:MAG: MmcQ/YjbR family DNA-binding protein [Bacteroidales bacterium]|nr:MmcQ/YjbR family DNA-binding protein [Bacteroidales bacterium]
MNIEDIRTYCLSKKAVSESFPFNDTTLVFKVEDKIFALLNLEIPQSINLKCAPEKALRLREEYHFILPGYHMNKKHWNTILLDEFVADDLLRGWIDDSYRLVVLGLPSQKRQHLEG